MFCKKCGKKIADDASFCVHCGAKITWPEKATGEEQAPLWNESQSGTFTPVDLAALEAAAAQEPDPALNVNGVPRMTDGVATDVADRIMNNPAKPASPKHRRNVAVITLLVAIAVVAVVFVGLMYWHHAEEEAAHALQTVNFQVTAEGYNQNTDTAMLVHVEGTDLDGNPVSTDAQVDPSGVATAQLMQGDYVASVPASPVLADGTLFKAVAASEFTVAIAEDNVFGEAPEPVEPATYTATFSFTEKVPVLEVTDEMLNASYAMAIDAGQDADTAKALCDHARALRDEALEQARKLEENHIDGAGVFTFDIPEYWWDKVEVTTKVIPNEGLVSDSGEFVTAEATFVSVNVIGTETWLVRFEVCQSGYRLMHGDISGGMPVSEWTGNGRHVELRANTGIPQLPATANEESGTAVELLSFGAWSYGGVTSDDYDTFASDVIAAVNEKLVPTVAFA